MVNVTRDLLGPLDGLLELGQDLDLALVALVDLVSSFFNLILDELLELLRFQCVDDLPR